MEWPYQKPVFVLSNSLKVIPEKYKKNVQLVNDYLDFLLKLNKSNDFDLFIHEFNTTNKDVLFMIQLINGVKEYRLGNTESAVYIFISLISQNVEKSKELFKTYIK